MESWEYMKKNDIFQPEQNYQRYIIGKFHNADFVPKMLKEYGELCVDSPQITEYEVVGSWTIIPCGTDLISRGNFLDLMSWLCQEGETAFAIAIHEKNSYFAVRDTENPFGDTVFVKFDDGTLLFWYLPRGLVDDMAYDVLEDTNILQEFENHQTFLKEIDAVCVLEEIEK